MILHLQPCTLQPNLPPSAKVNTLELNPVVHYVQKTPMSSHLTQWPASSYMICSHLHFPRHLPFFIVHIILIMLDRVLFLNPSKFQSLWQNSTLGSLQALFSLLGMFFKIVSYLSPLCSHQLFRDVSGHHWSPSQLPFTGWHIHSQLLLVFA